MIIETALVFGVLSFLCALLIFIKLPKKFKKFLIKKQLLTDGVGTSMVWLTLSSISSSLIAAMASAFAGVFISAALWWQKKKMQATGELEADGPK